MSKKTKSPHVHEARGRATVKHDFTTQEWKEKTDTLTRKMKEVELREEAIKAEQSTAKAAVKRMKSEVNDLANDLRNGYQMLEVDVTIKYDRKKGIKKFYHFAPGKPHNGDFIREEAMSEADFQELPLDEQAAPASEAAVPAEGSAPFNPALPPEAQVPAQA